MVSRLSARVICAYTRDRVYPFRCKCVIRVIKVRAALSCRVMSSYSVYRAVSCKGHVRYFRGCVLPPFTCCWRLFISSLKLNGPFRTRSVVCKFFIIKLGNAKCKSSRIGAAWQKLATDAASIIIVFISIASEIQRGICYLKSFCIKCYGGS